jgi:hypothetical protein
VSERRVTHFLESAKGGISEGERVSGRHSLPGERKERHKSGQRFKKVKVSGRAGGTHS